MAEVEVLSDAELQELMVNGDYQAFTVIYSRYVNPLKQFLFKILKSTELTEDITQEVFIKVWANRAKLAQIKSFKAYLYIAARNHALDSLKAAFRSEVAMGEVIRSFIEQRDSTAENLLDKEYRLFLDRVLASLPERTREIFALCREQGKSYDEVADILGISRNAVKNHMVFSMKILSNSVKKELGISLSILLTVLFRG
ncbi:RNA polymerase sigma factor [Mucilaginibacter paludis]|uniref:RNA polymerase, sigma-24 subunit, ECF subfamily n=1 Tax=Mucilaginibacter paludis DSM 18603 TaxID=714943 RepID=H1YBE9_9SPHI|nr:RNA polymerase sigma-70 factor [Mucilaginibacter paludis]EHQ31203.1 RNA polymerase, sigma-24 subunit, ECF subfamily [Mucilaginibacter paludis DSM 18603]